MNLSDISTMLQVGRAKDVQELVQQAVREGMDAREILEYGLLDGMNAVGEKFKRNEVFVPQVLIAARAMNAGVSQLRPLLTESCVSPRGSVCIGTVEGDMHDIGKNLVRMMLEGKGFSVVDLGTDVSPESFVKAATEHQCGIVCCSALLTTTMTAMGDVVKAFEEAGIRNQVKIMVGGAPVTEAFARQIGADAYTDDAVSAATRAVELCGERARP